MTFDRGCRHRIKSIGPRTDHCGTPWWRQAGVECLPSTVTIWVLFSASDIKERLETGDWNQVSIVFLNPNTWWRQCSKISWSMVSNTADWSRKKH